MGRICCTVTMTAVIVGAGLAAAPPSMSATTGLVAAYGFDEGTGTTVTDASGNGNTGTITSATWAATGKFGKALQFNGTNAVVTVPNAASLQLSAGMTLEAWVNPSSVTSKWRDVIYKGNDNYYLEATSTNASKPDAGMIAGGSYADAVGTAKLTANTWSYLTETYDGTTLRLYVNGTQVASTVHTGAIATSTNPLQFGGDSIYGQNFAGLIDEVRIYNVALTAAQIQTDMTTPVNNGPDTTPPTQPGTLSTNVVGASEVDLSWGASTDNVGVTGYQVERCQGTGCTNFAQIATTTGTGTTYKDTSTVASTTYSYRVRATDAASNLSTYSNTASATTPTPDTTPPTQPGTLSTNVVSASEVDLSWGASTDNVGVTGYKVERCSGTGCTNFAQIATTTGTGTTYKDTSTVASTTYSYRVRATDAASNLSTYSNTASATTPTPDTTPPTQPGTLSTNVVSASEVDLSWGASTDNVGVTGYKVERCSGTGCTNFAQIATTTGTGTTYKDTSTVASTTYSYRVRATDAAGNLSTYSNTASATTPAGPSGLVAAYAFDEGSGTTVSDASGNGHNGTISNATWAATGKFGKALQFNGGNALVSVPSAAQLQLSTGMTLEAWVNPSAVSATWQDVIYKGNDNYYLEATSTNASKPDAGMIAGGSYADAVGTAALPANSWSYLTETYDGSTLKLYVNGTQVASVAHTGAIASSTNALQIGGDTIYSQYFAGLIDEVRIYNVALTAGQIQSDMTTPIGGSQDTTPPTQPGTLSTNVVSASEVDLSWGASTDNVGVTGYQVERCQGTGCTNFAQIATTTGTGTTYKDTSVSAPNSYSYRVRATDAAGNLSTYSNTASATTTIGPPTKLAFVQGPTSTAAGATITPAVTVAVEDANGNVETSDNATQVSLAIGTNPASGTLSGGSAVTVASGVATFSGLSIDKAGTGYTLTASSTPSYTGATSLAFNITSGTASGSWTTYLAGIDRTGFASGESGFNPTSVQNLHQAWKASDTAPNHGVFAQPVVSNGLVYWGSNDGFERATSTSGNLVWQTNLGRTSPPACTDPSSFGISSTPTITTDVPVGGATSVMYIGGGDSKLYALNAATGAVLWSYDVGGNPDTFLWDSPAVFGNSVYIGVASFGDCPLVQGQILQLNRVTGALQNQYNIVPNGCTGGGVWGSITVDAAASTLYFATGTPGDCPASLGGPSLIELTASNLSLVGIWTVPQNQQDADPDFGSTPTLFTGTIGGQSVPLVGMINKNGVFYALKRDALASGPVWSTRIATGGGNPTIGQGDQASAAYDGTRLYVGGDNTSGCSGTVNALNPLTGAFIWQHCFTDGGFVIGGVTVTSGGVVAVGEGSNVAMVSAATGASVATFTGTGPFYGPPSVAGGTLYEGDMSGNIYALTTN